jgi:hypothetical protein
MDEGFEVLSALLDREPVDVAQLGRSLEDPRGRRALVDFVRLRQATDADDARPRAEFYARVHRERGSRWRIISQRISMPVAAAALLAVVGGFLLSSAVFWGESGSARPPEATRVLRFEPGVDWQP